MQSGTLIFPVIERLIYGEPAAQAVAAEAERRGAQRVFILASGTLNRKTDEVARMRAGVRALLWAGARPAVLLPAAPPPRQHASAEQGCAGGPS